jgi:hypothetical protein
MKFLVVFGIALLCAVNSMAQVSYSHKPASMQLFPRDASDSAEVKLAGVVTQQGLQAVIFKLYRDGSMLDSTLTMLNYQNSVAPFNQTYKIKAEKSEYKIHFSLYDGVTENCILAADSIVAGDVFIVNGQSNASAPNQGTGAIENDEWVRTFGTSFYTSFDCAKDTLWGLGLGKTTQSNLAIGVWSMKLAKMLSDSLQVPICIINGARFGSRIVSHLPNMNNRSDLNTIYGRLLFRANKAGVANNIKGLFWYQGESDCDTAYVSYSSRFNLLYDAWKSDFPGLSRLFVMQTRPGCVVGTNFLYHQQLREIHRSLESTYSDITLMSTAGLANFDGCHYLSTGYNLLATRLYALVLRDVYGANAGANIDPPKILNGSFVDSSNTLLAIKMSQNMVWPALFNGHNIINYFYFNTPGLTATTGWSSADTLYLKLSSSTLTPKISYLPGVYYNNSTQIYMGPWLTNANGIGALTYHQFNLSHQLSIESQGSTLLCNGDSVLLTTNKNTLGFQWSKNGVDLLNENSNSIWVKNGGDYVLKMSDAFGNQIQSNSIQIITGDAPVEISTSGNTICQGDSVLLGVNTNASIVWSNGSNQPDISVMEAGWYQVTAVDSWGCISMDSTLVTVNPNPDAHLLFQSLAICDGDSAKLFLEGGEIGAWSNGSIDSCIYPKQAGFYSAVVTNSYGCKSTSDLVELVVNAKPVAQIIHQALSICAGDSAALSLKDGDIGIWSNGIVDSLLYVKQSGYYSAMVTNSLGCSVVSDSVLVMVHPKPVGNLLNQSLTICNGDSTALYLENGEIGMWSNGILNSLIYAKQTGYYSAIVTNAFGCSKQSDSVFVNIISTNLSIVASGPLSTCSNQKITLSLENYTGTNYQWKIGVNAIPGATSFKYKPVESGTYSLSLIDSFGCIAQSQPLMVTVNKVPNSKFTLSNQFDTCIDSLVTLTANSGAGLSYQWYRNGIILPGATNRILNTQQAGNYSVLVSNAWGCTKLSALTTIPVSNPSATIQVNGNSVICSGDSVKLSANLGAGFTYQWMRNNAVISGATSDFYYVKRNGFYRVVITNGVGCSAASPGRSISVGNCNITNRISAESDFDLNQIKVYPNPFKSSFRVECEHLEEQLRWELVDVMGRIILLGELAPNRQFLDLDGSELQQGLYFLKLESQSANRIIKIQKAD